MTAHVFSSLNGAAAIRPAGFCLVTSIASGPSRTWPSRANSYSYFSNCPVAYFSSSSCLQDETHRTPKSTLSESKSAATSPTPHTPPPTSSDSSPAASAASASKASASSKFRVLRLPDHLHPPPSTSAPSNPPVQHFVNPSHTTRPPPLNLPPKPDRPGISYYWALSRAIFDFYKEGIRNLRLNYSFTSPLRHHLGLGRFSNPLPKLWENYVQLNNQPETTPPSPAVDATGAKQPLDLTRSQFQLLWRTAHDVRRVIPFLVTLYLCAELTPVLIAMGLLKPPQVCMLPSQREKDRMYRVKMKTRVAASLGLEEGQGVLNGVMPPRDPVAAIRRASEAERFTACLVFGLSGRSTYFRSTERLLVKHFKYLLMDDSLILKGGGVAKMEREEVERAVFERGGVEVGLGLSPAEAELDQRWWLNRWLRGQRRGVKL
ncbi:hypothetical protein VTO42DRAFT_7036 [Malbranchea cinnamomea]